MKNSHDTNTGSQTPDIPSSITELIEAGFEMKLHLVQHPGVPYKQSYKHEKAKEKYHE